ncbi:hypothetical protein ACFYU8_18300 [Brevibacillus sp. NPDC003359]|uniref:hypothetical protein n=1 Tax=unclassified Brevibacillus TaxID=2684853 RepID=UPI0036A9906B
MSESYFFVTVSESRKLQVESIEQAVALCSALCDRENLGVQEYYTRNIGLVLDTSGYLVADVSYTGILFGYDTRVLESLGTWYRSEFTEDENGLASPGLARRRVNDGDSLKAYFLMDQAKRLVMKVNSMGFHAWYNEEEDAFYFRFSKEALDATQSEVYSAETVLFNEVDAIRAYPIGAGKWPWKEALSENRGAAIDDSVLVESFLEKTNNVQSQQSKKPANNVRFAFQKDSESNYLVTDRLTNRSTRIPIEGLKIVRHVLNALFGEK